VPRRQIELKEVSQSTVVEKAVLQTVKTEIQTFRLVAEESAHRFTVKSVKTAITAN
jgi:hypothetical protein